MNETRSLPYELWNEYINLEGDADFRVSSWYDHGERDVGIYPGWRVEVTLVSLPLSNGFAISRDSAAAIFGNDKIRKMEHSLADDLMHKLEEHGELTLGDEPERVPVSDFGALLFNAFSGRV